MRPPAADSSLNKAAEQVAAAKPAALVELRETAAGLKLRYNLHLGQARAWRSQARIVLVLAGSQSGKTSFGPIWLRREMQLRGPGDYLVAAPTYPLLELKLIPEFKRLFVTLLGLGEYVGSPVRRFTLNDHGMKALYGDTRATALMPETKVFFGHAQDPDSLESATGKGAWLDEAGQKKFKLESFEAVQRRLALAQGRTLITTTPYNLGWLKQRIWDRWKAGDLSIEVVNFSSLANPLYPRIEAERVKRDQPAWKYIMFVLGEFSRPAGMIYDNFDSERHATKRFAIPTSWPRFMGIDFGQAHTAAVFIAEEPRQDPAAPRRLYVYRTYGPTGGLTPTQHLAKLLAGEPERPVCFGGSHSEDQWRTEYRMAGLAIQEPPITSVEVGIDRVYGGFARDEWFIFDDLEDLLDELGTYSRGIDAMGEPIPDTIEDKADYHLLDAWRYIASHLQRPKVDVQAMQSDVVFTTGEQLTARPGGNLIEQYKHNLRAAAERQRLAALQREQEARR